MDTDSSVVPTSADVKMDGDDRVTTPISDTATTSEEPKKTDNLEQQIETKEDNSEVQKEEDKPEQQSEKKEDRSDQQSEKKPGGEFKVISLTFHPLLHSSLSLPVPLPPSSLSNHYSALSPAT